MAENTFKAKRVHNRKFPGKLGRRPDKSQERRESALNRHMESSAKTKDQDKQDRIITCINNTRKNLGQDGPFVLTKVLV